jgi:hypothetical protein
MSQRYLLLKLLASTVEGARETLCPSITLSTTGIKPRVPKWQADDDPPFQRHDLEEMLIRIVQQGYLCHM